MGLPPSAEGIRGGQLQQTARSALSIATGESTQQVVSDRHQRSFERLLRLVEFSVEIVQQHFALVEVKVLQAECGDGMDQHAPSVAPCDTP